MQFVVLIGTTRNGILSMTCEGGNPELETGWLMETADIASLFSYVVFANVPCDKYIIPSICWVIGAIITMVSI